MARRLRGSGALARWSPAPSVGGRSDDRVGARPDRRREPGENRLPLRPDSASSGSLIFVPLLLIFLGLDSSSWAAGWPECRLGWAGSGGLGAVGPGSGRGGQGADAGEDLVEQVVFGGRRSSRRWARRISRAGTRISRCRRVAIMAWPPRTPWPRSRPPGSTAAVSWCSQPACSPRAVHPTSTPC